METSAPVVALDKEALIEEERQKVEAFYDAHPDALDVHSFGGVAQFVRLAYERHADLIQKFGGWRYDQADMSRNQVGTDQVQQCWHYQSYGPWVRSYEWFVSRTWDRESEEIEFIPGCSVKIRRGQVVSRAVLSALQKRYAPGTPYYRHWEMFFERLGQAWAAAKGVGVRISAAPSDFLLLGVCGEDSCYRIGGEYEHSKLNLALMRNSVVVQLFNAGYERTAANVAGRMWGFIGDKGAGFSNLYLMDWTRFSYALHTAIESVLGVRTMMGDNLCLGRTNFKQEILPAWSFITSERLAYVNGDRYCFLAADADPTEVGQRFLSYVKELEIPHNGRTCPSCEERLVDEVSCAGCGSEVCGECAEVCDACHEYYCSEGCAELVYCTSCDDDRICGRCRNGGDYSCENCDAVNCLSCQVPCDSHNCTTQICTNCETACPDCRHTYCTACVTKSFVECADCGFAACPRCARVCEGDGENPCETQLCCVDTCSFCTERRESREAEEIVLAHQMSMVGE